MIPKPLYLTLIGPQGSGKGTQAELLRDYFRIPSLSMGAVLREIATQGTLEGDRIKVLLAQGSFIGNDVTGRLIIEHLSGKRYQNGVVLDGYPRDLVQARALSRTISLNAVVAIEISDAEATARLSGRIVCSTCGANYNLRTNPPLKPGICNTDGQPLKRREDDTPEAIKKRLLMYHEETEPLFRFYKGITIRIHGEQTIAEVHQAIIEGLKLLSIER